MKDFYIIGGANIDIMGKTDTILISHDSNIGKVTRSFGGVGRNIAENIARYGVPTHMISAVGNDYDGKNMIQYCESADLDMSDTLIVDGATTSTYLAVLDHEGDMMVAINDMAILKYITKEHIERVFTKIRKDDLLVLDTNLERDLIEWILMHAPCPVFMDPISCNKAVKLRGLLKYVHTLKPNIYEAETLSGLKVECEEDLVKMGQYFLDEGVQEIFISMASEGVFAMNKDEHIHIKPQNVHLVNATGAGDASMGALCVTSATDMTLKEKVLFSQTASILTLQCEESVCPSLSFKRVQEGIQTIDFITIE